MYRDPKGWKVTSIPRPAIPWPTLDPNSFDVGSITLYMDVGGLSTFSLCSSTQSLVRSVYLRYNELISDLWPLLILIHVHERDLYATFDSCTNVRIKMHFFIALYHYWTRRSSTHKRSSTQFSLTPTTEPLNRRLWNWGHKEAGSFLLWTPEPLHNTRIRTAGSPASREQREPSSSATWPPQRSAFNYSTTPPNTPFRWKENITVGKFSSLSLVVSVYGVQLVNYSLKFLTLMDNNLLPSPSSSVGLPHSSTVIALTSVSAAGQSRQVQTPRVEVALTGDAADPLTEEALEAAAPENVKILIKSLISRYAISREQYVAIYDEFERQNSPEGGGNARALSMEAVVAPVVSEGVLTDDGQEDQQLTGDPRGQHARAGMLLNDNSYIKKKARQQATWVPRTPRHVSNHVSVTLQHGSCLLELPLHVLLLHCSSSKYISLCVYFFLTGLISFYLYTERHAWLTALVCLHVYNIECFMWVLV